jgi:5'-deoxynucleotidase YfbR-like HD superfamily hydrolase
LLFYLSFILIMTETTSAPNMHDIAGIALPDTPLVQEALSLAWRHLDDVAYNHVLRCTAVGILISDKIPALQNRDRELHVIAALLHDLGWDRTGAFVSPDKRFEVDGANAARDFVRRSAFGSDWDERRLQVLWDSIALHTQPDIAWHKEAEVKATQLGILADFGGVPVLSAFGLELSEQEWTAVCKEYLRSGFKEGVKQTLCGLCQSKPATTFDNFVGDFGEEFAVAGYSRKGRRFVDMFAAMDD